MHSSKHRKRMGENLFSAASDFGFKVRKVFADGEKVLRDEEERVTKARMEKIRNTPKEIEFFTKELSKIWNGLNSKAMDALCRTIIAVIEDTDGFISDQTSAERKLQSDVRDEDITDVVMRYLDRPFDTTGANVVMQNDTCGVSHEQSQARSEDQTQLQTAGGTQDALANLFSLLEEIDDDEVKLNEKFSGHVNAFVRITQQKIKEFSDEYHLDIHRLVKTVVKNTLDNWENEECTGKLREHMQSVIDITSRASIVQRKIELLKEKYGGLARQEESQPLDSGRSSPDPNT